MHAVRVIIWRRQTKHADAKPHEDDMRMLTQRSIQPFTIFRERPDFNDALRNLLNHG